MALQGEVASFVEGGDVTPELKVCSFLALRSMASAILGRFFRCTVTKKITKLEHRHEGDGDPNGTIISRVGDLRWCHRVRTPR